MGRKFKAFFREPIKILQNSEKLATIRFLKHEPISLSYIAQIISDVIPTLTKRAGSKTIETNVEELTNRLAGFYPPYLKNREGSKLLQITRGRVIKGCRFLDKIKYLDLRKDNSILMERSKGKMIGDLLEYFLDKEATIALRMSEKEIRKQAASETITLDSFINNRIEEE